MTPLPLRLVIFDCDGVLVDSEGPSNRVVARGDHRAGLADDDGGKLPPVRRPPPV